MDVKEIVNERLKRKYEIVLPFQKIAELEKEKLEEVQSTVQIRGFRPGKVPMSLIKKRFGEAVRSDVLDKHSKSVLDEFLKSKDEKPVAGVTVDLADRKEANSDFVLKVDYECTPQIPDIDLSSIELEKLVVDIDDDFVTRAVRDDILRFPSFEDAPEDYEIRRGDRATLNYRVAPLDDRDALSDRLSTRVLIEPIEDNEKTRFDAMMFDQPPPGRYSRILDVFGFAGHLIGMKVGDKAEIELDVPEEAVSERRSGKRAIFNIEIESISMHSADLSAESFARKLEYSSVDAYRLEIMTKLKRHYDSLSYRIMLEDLIQKLDKMLEIDMPEVLIDNEIDFQKRQLGDTQSSDQENRSDESSSAESNSGVLGTQADSGGEAAESDSEIQIRKLAERRVKHFLFLEYLSGKHSISLEPDDVMDFVNKFSNSESDKSSVIDRCQKDAGYRERIMNLALSDKTTNFVLELVNVETKKIPPEDMINIYREKFDMNLLDGLGDELNAG